MLDLHQLSPVGFGSYRISASNSDHYAALKYALESGCNLIDTAATYTRGGSESMIGQVLSETRPLRPFIITKAGYIEDWDLDRLRSIATHSSFLDEKVVTKAGTLHSIHPDFLDIQLTASCNRMGISYVDGFLLHNPEYYFQQPDGNIDDDEYWRRIRKAFECLEEKVQEGKIRYYGISSNTLPLPIQGNNATDLEKLIAIANEVSFDNHFKLIQFPLNFIENEAGLKSQHGRSFLDIARENGMVSFSNRPLNAITRDGLLRLAVYERETLHLNAGADRQWIDDFIGVISKELIAVGIAAPALDFIPIQVIDQNWDCFENTEIVEAFFSRHLHPFVQKLFGDHPPPDISRVVEKLFRLLNVYAKKRMTDRTRSFATSMCYHGPQDGHSSFAKRSVEYCLNAGADHVLVGMRTRQYVHDLKDMFNDERRHRHSVV